MTEISFEPFMWVLYFFIASVILRIALKLFESKLIDFLDSHFSDFFDKVFDYHKRRYKIAFVVFGLIICVSVYIVLILLVRDTINMILNFIN